MRQILELAYGESVVPHIMSGKAIERTTRAHYLVNAALNTLLEEKATDEKANH